MTILDTLAYENMVKELSQMKKTEINEQLNLMGCNLDYDGIQQQLLLTYNELSIADMIFETCQIKEGKYPKSFIDEVILEIAIRENYGFFHYGVISSKIRDIMENDENNHQKIIECMQWYRKLFQCAQKFQCYALETMQYQVNDGIDLYAHLMDLLDLTMQQAQVETSMYRTMIDFCEKFLKTFHNSHPLMRASVLYEQATAYIRIRSKKGEQIFQQLLKEHSDPCDVVLHYALAYMDTDEKRGLRILHKYQSLWDKESEAYEVIQQLIQDEKSK